MQVQKCAGNQAFPARLTYPGVDVTMLITVKRDEHFTMITSQKAARQYFNEEFKPGIVAQYGHNDIPALDEAFNNWVDSMTKDGYMPVHAYNWSRT